MKKIFVIFYSILCYVIGLAVVAWYADFFIGYFIPKSINEGEISFMPEAFIVDVFLVGLFVLPHTIMARPSVKKRMRLIIPYEMERSTYILISSVTLFALCIFWRPMPYLLFDLRGTMLENALWMLYGVGWFFTLFSTFLIDHFDLFGLKQAWNYKRSRSSEYKFVTPLLYKLVRHPIYLGWLLVHWCTPVMSAGQLMLAVIITFYILIAVEYEERDLISEFGEQYRKYKRSTPKLIPIGVFKSKIRSNQDFLFF